MLEQVKLVSEPIAYDYIRRSLAQGHTLARLLLHKPLETGNVFTYVPPATSRDTVLQFEQGGVLLSKDSVGKVRDMIIQYLGNPGKGYVIFEDAESVPTDPWLKASKTPFCTYASDVYHFLDSSNKSEVDVDMLLAVAIGSYPTIGILTNDSNLPLIQSGEQLGLNELGTLVHSVEYILIGAYDGEGFLIWGNEKKEPQV